MASVFMNNCCIDYSIVSGEIRDFARKTEDGEYETITEDRESRIVSFAKKLVAIQSRQNPFRGFSAFLYKLADNGKIVLPEVV